MPYCTLTDLITHEPLPQLIQLSNDDPAATAVDQTNIDACIAHGDSVIDDHIRGLGMLPLAQPYPPTIVDLSIELALCHLFLRRYGYQMPPTITDRQSEAIRTLEKIKAGKIQISEQEAQEEPASAIRVSSPRRRFTRRKLHDYDNGFYNVGNGSLMNDGLDEP